MFHMRRISCWEHSTEPEVRHYKVSFKLDVNLKSVVKKLRTEDDKITSSYGVVRRGQHVYIVYFNGWVNCCGSRTREQIVFGVERFREFVYVYLSRPTQLERLLHITIDNITARGKLAIDVRLTDILRIRSDICHCRTRNCKVSGCRDPEICFRPMYYPGAHVRFAKKKGGGLLTLYQSGSYTIVGVKNTKRLMYVYGATCKLLQKIHQRLGKTLF